MTEQVRSGASPTRADAAKLFLLRSAICDRNPGRVLAMSSTATLQQERTSAMPRTKQTGERKLQSKQGPLSRALSSVARIFGRRGEAASIGPDDTTVRTREPLHEDSTARH